MYLNLFLLLSILTTGFSYKTSGPATRQSVKAGILAREDTGNNAPKDIVCLIYHRFGDPRYPSTNTSANLFKLQLQYLKDHNFNVITFSKAVDAVFNGGSLPGKTVVITIDDGFSSFKENALPLLDKFGYKATLFVNTSTVGAGDYMSWEDLAGLLKDGFEIGNHSDSHDYFLNRKDNPVDYFKTDVQLSKKLLHEKLGIDPDIFAYPYGEFDKQLIDAVKSMGFVAAAAQNSGVLCESSDPYAIPRFPMNNDYGAMTMFIEKVNMKALRVSDTDIANTLYSKNPPTLSLSINMDQLDIKHIQGFTQGGLAELNFSGDPVVKVKLSCSKKLTARRVIYTITVPGLKDGQWYWYSHIWINPNIKD